MITISPQSVDHNRSFVEHKDLQFDLLSDPGNKVAERFNLSFELSEDMKDLYRKLDSDLEQYNEERPWSLPLPARYIVDSDGIIRYARVNADYTNRPEPKETLDALQALLK